MNKKMIIILSVLVLFLIIGGVSASETNTTDEKVSTADADDIISSTGEFNSVNVMSTSGNSMEENILTQETINSTKMKLEVTDTEILKAGDVNSFSDLNTLISGTEESTVLILDKNYEFVVGTDNKFNDAGISIKKTLTIDGNSHTINAKGHKLFTVTADNVILKNLNIVNSSNPITWDGENGKINNLNFANCIEGVNFKTNDLEINNSKFENCIGQVINIGNLKNALIYNTKFINCSSSGNTIISMVFTENIVFSNCDFIKCSNTGTVSGGAIFTEFSTTVFENCKFDYNSGLYAGAIYSPRSIITINNCNFTNNQQTDPNNGGGVVFSGGDLVYISNSRFENNRGRVGVLRLSLDSTVDGSVFINNVATSDLGIILFDSSGESITNCEFYNNQYSGTEAPLFYIVNDVRLISIDNCIIQDNHVSYISNIFSTEKDSKISFTNTKIYNNVVKDYLFNINSDNTINFNLDCSGNRNNAGNTPATYDSSKTITPFVLYDELWANDVGGGNGLDKNHPTTLKNAAMNIKVMGTVHLLSKTYVSGSIGKINGIFKLIGEDKYNTNIQSGGNNGINVRYVSNITTSASISFGNHYVVDNIVIHDLDPLSAIVNTFDCVFSNWEFSDCSANSAYFRLAHSSKVSMINITFINCVKSGYVWFNGGCYHNEVINLTCINHATPINGLIRIGLQRADGNGWENMNNIIDGVHVYDSTVARVISREITDTTGKLDYFESCYNTINNINIYNTNVLNYVITLYPKDSLSNVMMYNITSAGDIIHTAANTTIKNINLTKVSSEGSLFGSDDDIYGFDPINIKMENITVSNANAVYAFNPNENSELKMIFIKNSDFSDCMGNLTNNIILTDSDFKDFTGNIKIIGNKVKVSNTNFTNGKLNSVSDNGGAIELVNGDNFIVDNCIFTGNIAYNGGAIYIRSVSNSSYIFNSKFYNNIVTNNGGAVFISSGISYYIDSNTRSTFGTSKRINDLYDENTIPLMHTVWVSSTGNGDGSYGNPASFSKGYELVEPYGYIYFKGETDTITNTASYICNKPGLTLIGNKSTTIKNIPFIVEEYASSFSIYNLIFTGCTDYSSITWGGENGLIDGCTFKNNGGEDIICGAAIQVKATNLNITNSIFINNIAGNDEGGYGGAIYCDVESLTINNCTFSENKVYYAGSHIYLTENANNILINNSKFNNGKITASNSLGSAIYSLSESNVIINESNFSNNVAVNGGALNIAGIITTLKITNNTFSANNASNKGGAIAFMTGTVNGLIMDNNKYKFNTAINGGAIYSNVKLIEKNSIFNNNGANYGGAIYLDSNAVSSNINYCNFTSNKGSGSAFSISANNVTIDKCIFKENIGIGYGAIDTSSGSEGLIVKNSEFYNNTATGDSGALLFASTSSNMLGYNLTFINNSAKNGGACRISGNNNAIVNSTFKNNKATDKGGAIYLYTGSYITIDDCDFIENEANYGGALYISIPHTNISNCNFTKNKANENGGAIYINTDNTSILASTFYNNRANNGAAVYIVNGKSGFEIKKSEFNKNVAQDHGVVYLTGTSNLKLGENTFINNFPTEISENYYILDTSMYTASKVYVTPDGTGSGLTEDDPTTIEKGWGIIENNGMIVFLNGEYEISKTISQNYTIVGRSGVTLKRSNDKYLFILQNGVVLNISDITLTAGIEAVSGSELNLDNVTFTAAGANDGGIIYDAGSSGSIVNSNFTGSTGLYDNHIVTVNGNVDINNTEFSSNSITDSALYYGNTGTGSISNSVFTDNQASNDVRNIHIEDISKVTLSSNTFDVNVIYTITNSTYGSLAYIQGTFDAGVNFNINNIKLIINDTGKTNTTVNINPTTNAFSFDVSGKLAVGKYNLTVSNNDGNKYNVNYLSNNFEVTKASKTINPISGITVSYGDNDTITVIGSITNNIGYGKNYTGDVSVIIADNDAVNATVSENGIFTVNVNVKAFNKGVYALNITVRGNDNYTGASKKFDSYLTVQDATIAITGIENITVDYGADYVIVNGTLNSTRFGANYTGNITVTVAGLSNKTQALDGKFSVRITNSTPFRAGKYDITASGEAISNYNAIAAYTLTDGLVVNGIVPEFIISAPSIGYGENATIYIILPDDATGKVVIEVENGGIKTIENIYGKNNITFGILPSGSYKVNATYYGDNNYRQVEANSTLFVERPRTSLNISVEDTFVGNNVLINFTINSAVTGVLFNNAGGSLRVYVGGDVYQVNVTNGKGSLSVPDLSIAGYNVIVIYSGDDNYAGCDGYGKFNVKGRETGLNITLSKDEALVGSNIIVTVKVNEEINDDPIYLYIDGKLYNILLTADGTAVFNVTNLKYGVHNITAVFTATSIFGAATNSTLVSIIKNNPNFSSEAVSDKDLHVFVKFTLPDDATGEVNITYEGTVIKTVAVTGGSQTVQLDGTYSANNYTFTMTYGGDDKYYNATASDTVEVGKISDYEMNITSSIILRDQDVTIYVNLPNEFGNNGTVNLTINGTSYNLPLINGGVSQTVHTTGLDTIEVVAIYSGYDNYDSKTVSKVFTVGQISEYDINITVDTAYVGDDVLININAPVQFDNVNFTITVNGIKANVSIIKGRGNYTVNNVSLGYYDVSVTSVDNKYFVAKTATGGFDVIKRTPVLNITDIPGVIYVNSEFNITVENNLKGDALIILYVDGVKKAEKSCSDNIFTINGLSSGNHIITVRFEGNDYYYSNSNSTTVNALKLDSTVSAHADNIDVGENLIVNVTASGNGSATIYIYDESGDFIGEYILSVKNGEGQIIVPYKFTEKGQYTINITYNGDDIYNVSENTASFLVDLATDYIFKVITTDAYVGSDVIVNVTLPVNANHDVTLTLPNGTNITKVAVNGIASFNIPDMAAGDYIVNATYAGDNNYARATKFGKFSVYKHDPVIDLSFNTTGSGVDVINSIVEGDKTTLIIQLPGDSNGYVNVTVSDTLHFNNQVLTGGKVTVALDDLTFGNYNIKVDYNGDDKYNNATNSIVLIVASSKPTVEILPVSTQVVGSNVDVSVKTNVDKGNVTLYVNGVKLETVNVVKGWANFTINNISGEAATVNVFAVYEANSQYAGAFNSTTFNVTKYTTTIDAVSNVNNITVKLLPGTTGSVIVTFNGINFTSQVNASGIGFISLPKVPGTYNLPVYYAGDSRYYSNSTMVEVNIPWGDDYILNATVNSTGYVTINIDSRANNVTINWDGSAPVTVDLTQDGDIKVGHYQLPDDLSVGSHIVVVSYAGDDNLGPKSYSLIYNVAKVNDYLFNITAESISVGSPAVIFVNLPDDATGFVVFTVNGEGYSINLADSRNLTLTGLGNGTYNVVAKYLGNDNYDVGENTTSFSVDKLAVVLELNQTVVEIGEVLCVLVKFNDNLINTQGEIEVDGDKFSVINGMAVIPASKLPNMAGVYTIDVKYLGDDVYSETKFITLNYEIIKVSDVTITVPGNVTIDQVLNITVAGADDGKLNVTIDNGAVFTVDVINGIASIPADKLPQSSGSHNINLTYWNGSVFGDKELNTVFYSDKITDYSFTISNSNIKFGENATIEINLPNDVTVQLTVKINGADKTVDIVGGYGKLENISGLHTGLNTVSAEFGSDKYETSTATSAIMVNPNDITLTITVPAEQLYVDQSATVTVRANVTMNNNVTLYINGKAEMVKLNNGEGSFTINPLVYGEYVFTAIFNGNENYTYATASQKVFNVDKNNVTLNITTDNVIVGHDVDIKVNINGDATGLVIVKVNNVEYSLNITAKNYDVTVPNLGNGTYTIAADYYGDNKYYGFKNSSEVTVFKMTPSITANETLLIGEDLEIVIENTTSIVDNPTGKVILTIEGYAPIEVDVVNGHAVVNAYSMPQIDKTYNAVVDYSGDNNYYALTWDITLRINKAPDVEITIPENVEIGDDLIITIGDETCDGLLNVSINNGEVFTVGVVNGTAVVQESYLPKIAGWYKINVNYYNATYWTGCSLETVFHEDLIKDYSINIKVTEDGKYATVTVEIPEDITRDTGILTINGNETELRITNGVATYTDMFKAGLYNITFAYGGNNKYNSKNNTIMFTKKSEVFTLNISIDDIFVDETARLNINLPADGDGIVLIDINGSKYYLESVNGSAYLDIKDLTYGTYNVTVRYLGSDLYDPRVNTTSFNVNKIEDYELLVVSSPSFDGKTTLTVYLPDDATGTVSILINNKTFTASVAGKQTTVDLDNILDGVNNYTLTYTGDDKYAVREITGSINSTGTRVNPTVLISADDVISGEYSLITVCLPDDATGQVTVNVDGNDYLLTVKNATVRVKVRLTHEGVYNVTAVYSGNGKWNNASNMTTLTVSRISSNIKLNISDDNIIAGVPFTVNVNVDLDATGDITLTVADKKYTAAIKDGLAVFNVAVDASGYYPVSASYDGDDKYTASQTSVVLINAAKNTPEITVNVSDINVGENAVVKITAPSDLTNTLIVKVGDNMYSVVDGTATIPGLGEGTYNISVIYPGDLKYDAVTVNASFKVSKVTDITPNITSNESGVVINLPEDATGNVTVKINNETYIVPVVNGTAVVPVSVNDTDNISVEYSGDDKYNSTDVNASVTDEGILITPQMTINVNSTINVGETAVLTVKLPADATGTVNVNVSGRIITALVSDGTATVDIQGLGSGNNLLEVTYLGDKKYAKNTQYANVYVLKLNPIVIIKVDDINVGENATVIVTVDGATGNVTLNGITKVLADSRASFTLSGYGQGTYTVSAVYNGDDNYNIASNTTTFNVNKVDNIDSSVSANTSVIQLPDDINGDVNVTINNQTYTVKVVNGTVQLPVNLSDNDTFSVSYGGDDKYDPITVNGTVNGDNVLITPTMSLSKDKDAYYAGDVAMISVVLPEDASGNVQYRVNGVNYTVLDVKGILMLPVKGSGDYNIEAIYLGDGKYATVSKSLSFAAVKINSTLQIMVNDTELHDTVIILVNVPADATGNVSIIVNEVKYSSVIADGVARFSIAGLAKGHYNVYAEFDGDVKYYKSENTSSFNVISVKTPVNIQIDVVRVGEDAHVNVKLPSYATGNVVLKVDGVSYFQEVGENTNLTFTVPNLDIGKHNITVTYSGDSDYSSFVAQDVIKVTRASFEYSINATNQTSIYNSGADFKATFYDVFGDLLTNATVKFIVDGKTYDVTTDSNGIGILNAKIPVGNHKVTAVNPDTGYSLTYDLTVKARLSGNKDLVMFYDEGVYGVRVMGDDGNYVGAGVAVKFTIGNKVFTASTNKDGWAYLNVKNIASGKYTIKAEYKGSSVSNMLTVKTLISAKKVSKVKKSAKKTIIQITLKGPKTVNSKNVKFKYNGKTKVAVKFGKDMKGIKVTVKFMGKNFKVKVNKKGMGTLKLTKKIAKKLKKGKKYKAKATWKGFKLYKNKKLTIKFNGKKYKVKTNKLSVAKFKVTKKMVKKLKKGKKVKYTIIYGADKQNKFIKIK